MEEIVGKWASLSIKEEDDVLGVDDQIIEKGKEGIKCFLMGKILSRWPVNKRVLQKAIDNLWKIYEVLIIRDVGRDLWLFSFDNEA